MIAHILTVATQETEAEEQYKASWTIYHDTVSEWNSKKEWQQCICLACAKYHPTSTTRKGEREEGRLEGNREDETGGKKETSSGQKRRKNLRPAAKTWEGQGWQPLKLHPTPLTNPYSFYKTKFLSPYSEQWQPPDWLRWSPSPLKSHARQGPCLYHFPPLLIFISWPSSPSSPPS